MRKWKYSANPHSAFMSDDKYFARWSKRNDMYTLFEPVKGDVICNVDRKVLVRYCQDNDLNCYTYLLYLFERYIDRYNRKNKDYYHLNQLPNDECTVKIKDYTCGQCHHLIFKDYRHREGLCNLYRLHRCFDDHCKYEEEMT